MEVEEARDVTNAEYDNLKAKYNKLEGKYESYMDDFIENEKENKQLRTVIWDSLKAIIKIIKNLESEISLPFEDLVDDISE